MKKIFSILFLLFVISKLTSQDVPENISYGRIYEFLDEMATDGFIEINSAIKPYSKEFIAQKLSEVNSELLSKRQKNDLNFYLKAYSLENNHLKEGKGNFKKGIDTNYGLFPPEISYLDSKFKASMKPILGMYIFSTGNNTSVRRWYGAEMNAKIGKNLSIYGSLRDISHQGGNLLSGSTFLNNQPGYEYTVGTDFSDSRGGIVYSTPLVSVGFVKDNIEWGDNIHGSNILSGRAPSFPMLTFKLTPTKWFELNYIHGWLVSNVLDSTRHYTDSDNNIYYRPANKFIAANFLTFRPLKGLNISIGNSIVYAESNVIPAFFLPIAFYKSIDHSLTKGLATENQNSQVFLNISSRNFKHLHLYTSIFADEIQLGRFNPESKAKNPISYKVGAKLSNYWIDNLSIAAEYTRTGILTYKHSISTLTWASNSYNLGNYLGDNADEFYAEIKYKPVQQTDISIYYNQSQHGNEYAYFRRGTHMGLTGKVDNIISQPFMNDVIWKNNTLGLKVQYELFPGTYAVAQLESINNQAFDAKSDIVFGEYRMIAQEVLNLYTPKMLQGKNTMMTLGLSFGF